MGKSSPLFRLGPIDLLDARIFVQREHSHLDAPIGGKCAVAVERRGGGGVGAVLRYDPRATYLARAPVAGVR